jgi:hypothetical protein
MKVVKKSILVWVVGCAIGASCAFLPVAVFADSQAGQWAAAGCKASLGGSAFAQQTCQALSAAITQNSVGLRSACGNACGTACIKSSNPLNCVPNCISSCVNAVEQ